ncbi:carotenoid oxygenase [Jaminaea rosea]|uniref:Carotenoid oxygenase n=1 Tax=Jaminaea rosea TaxID=1569628 RepID=A0A316USA4_9BASI|nr:carotenoid oxygenase [Jaminaea rosea]PWN27658.1 carotenoid oxygenase [Jaminaea rosea]
MKGITPSSAPSRRSSPRNQRLHAQHGYLSGNYAPVEKESPLTPCRIVSGTIPAELAGGQYVRNGGNPMANANLERESHWFDGDGMLHGIFFGVSEGNQIAPSYVNRYVVTDVLAGTSSNATRPILPSISTLSSPYVSLLTMLYEILRSLVLCLSTWIPWTWSLARGKGTERVSRISVANTSVYAHDSKVLAGCESGPPMQIILPTLDTAGWWTGDEGRSWAKGLGPMKIFHEMTTAHPHTDMSNNELLLYHSSFIAPYLRISVIPPRRSRQEAVIDAVVPGMKEGKLMHDFAASRTRTVVLDLPLSLDPRNLLKGKPIVHFDDKAPVRFGIFPRREPGRVKWYEDPTPACIYHTANCWDEEQEQQAEKDGAQSNGQAINFLACRLNSATLVYSAGNVVPPASARAPHGEVERCELYYWRFEDAPPEPSTGPRISHSFPLSRVPFEFPTINLYHAPAAGLGPNRFIYGCSMREGSFDAGMGRNSAKIDCLVKMDAQSLVKKGRRRAAEGKLRKGEAVDERSMVQVLADQQTQQGGSDDSDIRVFELPSGWYAQETSFVPRANAEREDDGYLLFFAFDEKTGLDTRTGMALPDAKSELWILDARDMKTIVARIMCAQRVPYGLHGKWFTAKEVRDVEHPPEEMIRYRTLGGNEEGFREGEGKLGLGVLRSWLQSMVP